VRLYRVFDGWMGFSAQHRIVRAESPEQAVRKVMAVEVTEQCRRYEAEEIAMEGDVEKEPYGG